MRYGEHHGTSGLDLAPLPREATVPLRKKPTRRGETRIMKSVCVGSLRVAVTAVATVLLALVSQPASAFLIDDPLHGQCNGSGGGACIDNGTNTPLGNSTSFSFSISPSDQTGDLVLEVLVPNNKTAPSPLQITETSPALVTLTATQHAGTWTSGNLDTFLGISASPNNPIGAFLPTTQGLDPGATGFNVFTADFGTLFIAGNPPEAQTPLFNVIGGLPVGSYIVAFCDSGCTTPPDVATANSGALLVDAPPRVPEPSSLLLLSAGLAGCAAFRRRRR